MVRRDKPRPRRPPRSRAADAHTRYPSRSKGKVKDKAQHAVILDKATSERLYKDVQSYRLVTVATLVDRMKINGSLARQCLNDLEEKGLIKPVVEHSKMKIYSTSSPRAAKRPSEIHDINNWCFSSCGRCFGISWWISRLGFVASYGSGRSYVYDMTKRLG